jgi:hypothetical protein
VFDHPPTQRAHGLRCHRQRSCLKGGWTPDLQTGRAEHLVRRLITAAPATRQCRRSGLVLWRETAFSYAPPFPCLPHLMGSRVSLGKVVQLDDARHLTARRPLTIHQKTEHLTSVRDWGILTNGPSGPTPGGFKHHRV